jgi:hypothetical protein
MGSVGHELLPLVRMNADIHRQQNDLLLLPAIYSLSCSWAVVHREYGRLRSCSSDIDSSEMIIVSSKPISFSSSGHV